MAESPAFTPLFSQSGVSRPLDSELYDCVHTVVTADPMGKGHGTVLSVSREISVTQAVDPVSWASLQFESELLRSKKQLPV